MNETVNRYKSLADRLVRNPDDHDALVEQYALLSGKGDKTRNHQYFYLAKRAYEACPNYVTTFNLAAAYERTGQYQEALGFYDKCLMIAEPDDMPELLHNIGISHRGMGNNTAAIAYYSKGLKKRKGPFFERDRAIAMMAGATMGTHSLVEGLKAFEVRRACAEEKFAQEGTKGTLKRLPNHVVHWQGEDLTGKNMVVYHEEGTGDFIQFSRFVPKLYDLGAKTIRLTGPHPDLLHLISINLGLDGVVPLANFDCDYVVGSMTIPWRTGIEYEDVDGEAYIDAEPALIPKRGNLNVGIVWRGSPLYTRDHLRSMPLEAMMPLFGTPGIAWHSLQIGHDKEITNLGLDGFIADLTPFMKNWGRTARHIAALDAVVSVDTAVAHLAGAMGKPVFIMVTKACDWRWNRESAITPWYQSARVFRQKDQGDWRPCVEAVAAELEAMNGRGRQTSTGFEPSSPSERADAESVAG